MMTFEQAGQYYAQLRGELQAGRLTQEQFTAQLANLQVQDPSGIWWRPDPATGGWLFFDGAAWRAQQPAAAPAPSPSSPARSPMAGQKGLDPVRLSDRAQKRWGVVSIAGGVLASLLWLGYSSLREGADWGTGFLMIAMPIGLAVLRRPIDRLLMVLQPVRQNIPRIILVGAGLAAPYVVGFVLYHSPFVHMSQYPFMRVTMVLGPLLAYLILRTPQGIAPGEGAPR